MTEVRTVSVATNRSAGPSGRAVRGWGAPGPGPASPKHYPILPLRGDPMARRSKGRGPRRPKSRPRPRKAAPSARFVGRDPSPVLDRYPPRPSDSPTPPPIVVEARAGPPEGGGPVGGALSPTPGAVPLITLDRGFDLDQFSSLLGESSLRVTVPREDLLEVLRRVLDFMGFGVYVYSIAVRPGPSDLLREFVVELRRVDFSTERREWTAFVEKDPGST